MRFAPAVPAPVTDLPHAGARRRLRAGGVALAALVGGGALAQPAAERAALPLWEIGLWGIAVSQQAYPGSDQNIDRGLALPYLIYRGEILRAERGNVGLRALRTETLELDIGFAAAFGSSSNEIEARRGMPNLGTLVEFGPRLKWHLGAGPGGGRWRVELPLRGVFDLSDGLNGRGLSFEPELQFNRRAAGGWRYGASLGAVFGNHALARTFYGVAPEYATATRPAYEARAGLVTWRAGVSASIPVARDWQFFAFARVDSVAGAANRASPLVRRTTGGSAGVGLTWTWMRSERTVSDGP